MFLLLDEPTASVDAASTQKIKASALKACREWGTTLIVASHDWHWVHEICNSVIPMFNGRVMENGIGNILFGHWRPGSGGCWEKVIEDGQMVRVSEPPSRTAIAVIPQDSFFLSLDKPQRNLRSIFFRAYWPFWHLSHHPVPFRRPSESQT